MKISICAIACKHNEEHYIDEWINYHLGLGIDDIYLFLDDWRDFQNTNDKVKDIHITTNAPNKQILAYNHFSLELSKNCDWVFFIDCDEYLNFTNCGTTLKYYLSNAKNNCSGIALNWKFYSGKIDDDNPFKNTYRVVDRFRYRQSGYNFHVKSAINYDFIRRHNMRLPTFIYPHNPVNYPLTCADDQIIQNTPFHNLYAGHLANIPAERKTVPFYIHHYWSKSFPEFANKFNHKRADCGRKREGCVVAQFLDFERENSQEKV